MDGSLRLHDSLYDLLSRKKSIVFERSRTSTEATATEINERNLVSQSRFPVKVKTHHSSVSKRLREDAEISIKNASTESLNAIISTSTLELGIDIGELDQVIQIGGLNSSSSFLQRVGRTGRRVGQTQFFRGLCTDDEELILLTGCVSLGLKRSSEAILLPNSAFHIMAHQTICFCLQNEGATAEQIWNVLSKAFCFSKITRSEFDLLISHMVQEDYLRIINGTLLLTGKKSEDEFLRANWKRLFAIFDTGPMYNVVDGKKVVGTLDSGFAREQQLPFVFVLGGQEWNALKIDHELQQIAVQKNETGIPPKWRAIGNFDVPFELAQEIGRLLMTGEKLEFLDLPAHRVIDGQRNTYSDLGWSHGNWILEASSASEKVYLWTFSGDKINRSLCKFLSSKIKGDVKYDYKRVIIDFGKESKSVQDIYDLITELRTRTEQELVSHMEMEIEVKWFSKFSACLPAKLSKKVIIEKDMDLASLVRELNKITIDY
jgi:ATP-dependent Lhr-like helicase